MQVLILKGLRSRDFVSADSKALKATTSVKCGKNRIYLHQEPGKIVAFRKLPPRFVYSAETRKSPKLGSARLQTDVAKRAYSRVSKKKKRQAVLGLPQSKQDFSHEYVDRRGRFCQWNSADQ